MNQTALNRDNMTDVCDELKKLENIIGEFIKIWKDNPKVQEEKQYSTEDRETYRETTCRSISRAISDIRILLDKMELFSLYMVQRHKFYTHVLTHYKSNKYK